MRDSGSDEEKLALLQADARRGVARAQRHLANRYLRGRGLPQDATQAAFWMRRAAEQGLAPAQRDYGRLLEFGQGVDADPVEAGRWYARAASQGDRLATEYLRHLRR